MILGSGGTIRRLMDATYGRKWHGSRLHGTLWTSEPPRTLSQNVEVEAVCGHVAGNQGASSAPSDPTPAEVVGSEMRGPEE